MKLLKSLAIALFSSDRWPITVLVFSIAWNWHLTAKLLDLSKVPRANAPVQKGMAFNKLGGTDVKGERVSLKFDHRGTAVLALFTSETCPHCEAQWPEWIRLIREIKKSGRPIRVVLLTHDSLDSNKLSPQPELVDTVLNPDGKTTLGFNFAATPQTLLLSPKGEVLAAAIGRDEKISKKVLTAFDAQKHSSKN